MVDYVCYETTRRIRDDSYEIGEYRKECEDFCEGEILLGLLLLSLVSLESTPLIDGSLRGEPFINMSSRFNSS